MSKYTTELRYICETFAGLSESKGYESIDEIINAAIPYVFDFNFPMFSENHRHVLQTKILRHFYMREIGFETVGMWKFRLQNKMLEIMPYYNELYKSVEYLLDPLEDVDYIRVVNGEDNGNSTDHGTSNQNTNYSNVTNGNGAVNTQNVNHTDSLGGTSDTPQGPLAAWAEDNYLSAAARQETDGRDTTTTNTMNNSVGSGNNNGTSEYDTNGATHGTTFRETKVKGKMNMKTKAAVITEYRKAILNIDMMIIDELNDLFMLIY